MTSLSGSALLALAVALGRMTPEEAWEAAHVDEDWQIGQWGEDAEAAARRTARWRDFDAAARALALLDDYRLTLTLREGAGEPSAASRSG